MPSGIIIAGGRHKRTAGRIEAGIDSRHHENTRSDSANAIRTVQGERQLLTNCWCELTQVWVNRDDLLAGFTSSCKSPVCVPPWDLPPEAIPAEHLKLPAKAFVYSRAWSTFDDAVLRSGVDNGLSYRKIGEALGKSIAATYRRAQQLGWDQEKKHASGWKHTNKKPRKPRRDFRQERLDAYRDQQREWDWSHEQDTTPILSSGDGERQSTYDRIAARLKKES